MRRRIKYEKDYNTLHVNPAQAHAITDAREQKQDWAKEWLSDTTIIPPSDSHPPWLEAPRVIMTKSKWLLLRGVNTFNR